MKQFFTLLILCFFITSHAQVSFEYLDLPIDTFVNNNETGFTEDIITLPNDYNANYQSFTGFSLSTMTDTSTPGFFNQYSVISGSGANESRTYAVGYLADNNSIFFDEPVTIESFEVNNTTYAALSMQEGDSYAKKFGGVTGDDPDFFLLKMKFFNNGEETGDTLDFYMADYRFDDNTQDYIIDEWTTINLTGITNLYDEIELILSSTDNGAFGMNTPNYIAIDNFIIDPLNADKTELQNVQIFPNPANDFITIISENNNIVTLYNSIGQLLFENTFINNTTINIENFQSGIYYTRIESEGKSTVKKIIKK
jgi:hypothetical protein